MAQVLNVRIWDGSHQTRQPMSPVPRMNRASMDTVQTWVVSEKTESWRGEKERKGEWRGVYQREIGRVLLGGAMTRRGSSGHMWGGVSTYSPSLNTPLTEKQSIIS